MKKRIFAALMASLLVALAICPLAVFAEEADTAAPAKELPKGLVIDCVGDSITWGSGSTNVIDGKRIEDKNYEGVLKSLIGAENCTIYNDSKPGASMLNDYAKNSISTGGYMSVKEITASFARTDLDVVIFMMGTNDSKVTGYESNVYKQGIWDAKYGNAATGNTPAEEFAIRYRAALDNFFQMESKPYVFCMLPPPSLPVEVAPNYRITDANMTKEGGVNDMIKQVVAQCQEEGLPVEIIDIRGAFPDPDTDQDGLKAVLADGVHPNQDGYKIMGETIYNALLNACGSITYIADGADEDAVVPKGNTFFGVTEVTVKNTRGKCTKNGVANTGWSTEPNGAGTVYNEGDTFDGKGDVTLYAIWGSGSAAGGLDTTTIIIIAVGAVVVLGLFAAGFVVMNKSKKKDEGETAEKKD